MHPIRNLNISSRIHSGRITQWPLTAKWAFYRSSVSADYNQLVYDQTVLGTDDLDSSNQTLSLIDFKLKGHNGNNVIVHGNCVSFPIIFVKAADE